jgi:hypothetical protein
MYYNPQKFLNIRHLDIQLTWSGSFHVDNAYANSFLFFLCTHKIEASWRIEFDNEQNRILHLSNWHPNQTLHKTMCTTMCASFVKNIRPECFKPCSCNFAIPFWQSNYFTSIVYQRIALRQPAIDGWMTRCLLSPGKMKWDTPKNQWTYADARCLLFFRIYIDVYL